MSEVAGDRRELALVIGGATTVGLTLALTFPLLTLGLERIGASPLTIGLNSAVGSLGIFLIGPFIGRLTAGFGPVRCIQASLIVCAVCLGLFALHTGVWWWSAVRLVYGCAAAMLFVLNEASVNSLAPAAKRGRVLGLYATLFSLGYAGGPMVPALVGTEGALPFAVAGGLFLVALVPTPWLSRVGERLRADRGDGMGVVTAWRAAPVALACVLAYAYAEGAFFALLPVWAIGNGSSPAAASALVGVWLSGNILFQIPIGWLADRAGRRPVLLGCCTVATAVLLLLPVVAHDPRLLWPLLVLAGGSMGALYTLGLMLLGERFRGPELTAANTVFVMGFSTGMMVGPAAVGTAMTAFGGGGFGPAILPAFPALAWLALRRLPRAAPAAT